MRDGVWERGGMEKWIELDLGYAKTDTEVQF
jgi:hypothetical protein